MKLLQSFPMQPSRVARCAVYVMSTFLVVVSFYDLRADDTGAMASAMARVWTLLVLLLCLAAATVVNQKEYWKLVPAHFAVFFALALSWSWSSRYDRVEDLFFTSRVSSGASSFGTSSVSTPELIQALVMWAAVLVLTVVAAGFASFSVYQIDDARVKKKPTADHAITLSAMQSRKSNASRD